MKGRAACVPVMFVVHRMLNLSTHLERQRERERRLETNDSQVRNLLLPRGGGEG